MILLCGLPSESPLAMVRAELEQSGARYVFFDQHRFDHMQFLFEVAAGSITGYLQIDQDRYSLTDFAGVYTRLMDDLTLPELHHEPEASARREHCRSLHDALINWMELTPTQVVNRHGAMASNSSKPYQMQLIREHGFSIPETLITNDPLLAEQFYRQHARVIYKSISSVRSIVQMMTDADIPRLQHIRWCPTQFQVFVEGTNVRVHVVGTTVFATMITTDSTDYRYASQFGSSAELQAAELDEDVAGRCVRLAQALNLPFAGIDLKITPDDQVYCFEVNPSPGFSYYEHQTQQPIARAVARFLAGQSN